ncbi:MAG TPA: SLC13 family permease [Gaiellaceae bacterium]|nr:SLC13 family permease [Gaiellaceae bacterium]
MAGLAHSAGQVWPAFALVTGLVLVGVVAEGEGLFAAAGSRLARVPAGGLGVYALALGLVAIVTAVLNLDTSVVFLTPVLLHLARVRGLDEAPFLYGAVTMSNAASLYLPGSNLTNLIVLHGRHASGATFLAHMWSAALVSTLVTAVVLAVLFRRELRSRSTEGTDEPTRARLGIGAAAIAIATVLVLATSAPALPVLATGIVAALAARVSRTQIASVVDVRVLGGLFALAVLLGGVGRWWHGPVSLIDSVGRWPTAGIAALATVLVNNLPAAVLLTPHAPVHGRALLLGLNLGPNLAVTGSLSAFLWLRIARSLGASPSVVRYSQIGIVLVPVSLAASLLV